MIRREFLALPYAIEDDNVGVQELDTWPADTR